MTLRFRSFSPSLAQDPTTHRIWFGIATAHDFKSHDDITEEHLYQNIFYFALWKTIPMGEVKGEPQLVEKNPQPLIVILHFEGEVGKGGRDPTTRHIWFGIATTHDFKSHDDIIEEHLYQNIFASHFGQLAVIFLWMSRNLFHDPLHVRPIAHAIWDPHFGQPAVEAFTKGGISGPVNIAYSSEECFLSGGNDLITIFIAQECFNLCSYLLSGYTKRDVRSNEATIKYLLMGGASFSILVHVLSWLYELSLSFPSPFHKRTPDVYEGVQFGRIEKLNRREENEIIVTWSRASTIILRVWFIFSFFFNPFILFKELSFSCLKKEKKRDHWNNPYS
ncbi:hypothetical protein IEQ34_003237 [Dendrobium chrysotoxum]|uniref:NADH:quinone oxidoreductase/Mrp antiporter transmembrane domain-containing protein n=1 Tax=Dendrobium chrysotoxum TaxID=161865 RepID=A0AAV7HJ47_DENCH|nr:hypothetical protein IEQ34_003237 [Dendrobium chrysotoxum]